jgi:hypothetical protein
VFLLKVGNHDETERWESGAPFGSDERLALDPAMLAREKRDRDKPRMDV